MGLANGCVTIQIYICFEYLQHTGLCVAHGHAAPSHLGPRLAHRLLLVGATPCRVLTRLGLVVAKLPTRFPLELALPNYTPIYPGRCCSGPADPPPLDALRQRSTLGAGPNSTTALRTPHSSPLYCALVYILQTPLQVVPVLMPRSCACTCIALLISHLALRTAPLLLSHHRIDLAPCTWLFARSYIRFAESPSLPSHLSRYRASSKSCSCSGFGLLCTVFHSPDSGCSWS
ncbi:hypothetical protein B0H13DRAFT_2353309 [Mycena leptocephala]|nr:hypothetical protein B0H13DRAFT_2353309 [Mycena leptocephala]